MYVALVAKPLDRAFAGVGRAVRLPFRLLIGVHVALGRGLAELIRALTLPFRWAGRVLAAFVRTVTDGLRWLARVVTAPLSWLLWALEVATDLLMPRQPASGPSPPSGH